MIYFFHHYELPAILQQIRIQEMLLQNQQAGQGNQTALQDNLNNNTSAVGPAGRAAAPTATTTANGQDHQPAPAQSQAEAPNGLPIPSPPAAASSDPNWMAETAAIITEAIITEALSAPHLDGALLESPSSTAGMSVTMEMQGQSQSAEAENQEDQCSLSADPEIKPLGCAQGLGPPGGGETYEAGASPSLTDCRKAEVGEVDTRQHTSDWDVKKESKSRSGPATAPSWALRLFGPRSKFVIPPPFVFN